MNQLTGICLAVEKLNQGKKLMVNIGNGNAVVSRIDAGLFKISHYDGFGRAIETRKALNVEIL